MKLGSASRVNGGFTLVELIAVIVILSVLSLSLGSRFDSASSSLRTSRDDIIAALFYAQQLALARASATNPVELVMSADQISVREGGIDISMGVITFPLQLPQGITLSGVSLPLTLVYDKLGRTAETMVALNSVKGGSTTIRISASGYAN